MSEAEKAAKEKERKARELEIQQAIEQGQLTMDFLKGGASPKKKSAVRKSISQRTYVA